MVLALLPLEGGELLMPLVSAFAGGDGAGGTAAGTGVAAAVLLTSIFFLIPRQRLLHFRWQQRVGPERLPEGVPFS